MQSSMAAAMLVALFAGGPIAGQADAANAVYRYRAAIAALLQLKPGMIAAEVGAAPPVIVPEMTPIVAATGKAFAATLDAQTGATNLAPASVDAVALIAVFRSIAQPNALIDGVARALKPGGALLVVDVPQENDGRKTIGLEADDVVKLAAASGLKREAESGIVPGHYAIRFRKP